MSRRVLHAIAVAQLALSCGGEPTPQPDAVSGSPWQPGVVYRSSTGPNARGLLDLKGLIHAHSVYSHDACDDEPRDAADAIREDCFADFRRGLCQTAHDFAFMTDHTESFARTEFPDVLLYRPDQGDELLERAGAPVASWLACPDAPPALILAGNEGALMPVGLERHVEPEIEQRKAIYGGTGAPQIEALKAAGAIVLAQHTENWSAEQLATLPFGGFEMYNLHANVISGAAGLLALLGKLGAPELLPHPDLTLLPIVNEDARYLERWGSVLAGGARRVTTIGTDCHQNALRQELPDGERMDSYRRMMLWMSNHLLVQPRSDGGWGDVELKEALSAARLYGAFELLGQPQGFDYYGIGASGVVEMGQSATLSDAVELRVVMPRVRELDPRSEPPLITTRLLRARVGGWDPIAEATDDLVFSPAEPGAYRAEIRIRPRHLTQWLSSFQQLAEQDFVWIYSNAIYIE
jgi:hypothetical protein